MTTTATVPSRADIPDVLDGDTRRDVMKKNARRALCIGAFMMPMLSLRLFGKTTATTETGLTVSDMFFFFSIVLLAFSRHRRKLPATRIWYVGVAFIVVSGIFATFHAQQTVQSIFVVARMVFVLLMWQWTIRHLADSETRMLAVMSAYVAGCFTSAFVAIAQLEGHVLLSFGTLFKGRSTGLAKHPDDTGSLLALGFAFAVGLAMHPRLKRYRPLFFLAIFVIGFGLVCTGSNSGMITALVGAIVAMVMNGLSPQGVFVVILVAVLSIGGLSQVHTHSGKSLNPIARLQAATGPASAGSNSIEPRIGTWKGSWHAIVNSPLIGHGLDIYSGVSFVDPYNNVAEETHDFVLMGWFQGGFFFLVGELICIAEGIRRMLLGRRRHPTRGTLVAGAVTVILFALQAPMLFDRYFWFPFVLAAAYPMLPTKQPHEEFLPVSA